MANDNSTHLAPAASTGDSAAAGNANSDPTAADSDHSNNAHPVPGNADANTPSSAVPAGGAGSGDAGSGDERPPEPSVGPACLVIVVLTLAVFSAVCAFGSFFFFSDQPALAERGINEQLIPWVESSNLSPPDKRAILSELVETVERVRSRQLTSRQLSRLKNALEDNPVLLWGTVEAVMAQADDAGLPAVEIAAGKRVTQRLLHGAALRKLSRNDLVYLLEGCTHTRADGQGLEVNMPLDAKQIRDFLGRAERFANGVEVPNEPYEKKVPEVFRGMIEEALSVK